MLCEVLAAVFISIHALRVEGDVTDCVPLINISQFQSTPSAWRATLNAVLVLIVGHISIHALRVEGDMFAVVVPFLSVIISIHALRMEGDWQQAANASSRLISIHALRVEGD